MADDVPWWARAGAHNDDPTADTPTAPAPEPGGDTEQPLHGDPVMCLRCSLPARWMPDASIEHADTPQLVTGECLRSGQGHGPWTPRADTAGDTLLNAMKRGVDDAP